MSVLYTFPGQGAQRPGMLHALPCHAETRRTLDQAASALDAAVRSGRSTQGGSVADGAAGACTDPLALDSAQALRSTFAVQLCLLIAGVAMARVLAAHGAQPSMVAGLSIGAYPAAVTAGVLEFEDAVRLVALRGRLMEEAYPGGYGMCAITGLERLQLEPLIAQVHSRASPVYLANLNAPRQLVLSGADAALAAAGELALQHGAQRAERLAVSVPSHCPLLDEQARRMEQAFAAVPLSRPRLAYISSSAARALFDAGRIASDLALNMARQVLWHDTARHAWERGARLAVEMPSGSVLTRLTAPVFEGGIALSCDESRLDNLLAVMAQRPA
ncbi:malonate decarboxylase subunit epsilon [Oxalobacteraceae bacterium A2-2]